MLERAIDSIAASLEIGLDVPVRSILTEVGGVGAIARDQLRNNDLDSGWLEIEGQCYFCAAVDMFWEELLIAGPFPPGDEQARGKPALASIMAGRIDRALTSAAHGLRISSNDPQLRLEALLMELLSNAIVAVSSELDLDTVLRRIVDLAQNFAAARFAALGLPGPDGKLETFIAAGMTANEQAKIGTLPEGRGLLGWLLQQNQPVRLANLGRHPMAGGFPPNHPEMTSFLGVPIMTRDGSIVGSLYLTEKRFSAEFTVEDEFIVDLLSRHAAVAIENARLYQAVQAHEQRLASVIEHLPEAIVLIESDPTRIVMMNQHARKLLDFDDDLPILIDDIRGRFRLFDAADRPVEIDDIAPMRSLHAGEIVAREQFTIETPAGNQRALLINSAPISASGTTNSAIVVFQDITEIRDADRLKDDFLSLVSHELRTPLTTIHGGSQILLRGGGKLDSETTRELLNDIHQESARLATLIQNMVQLAHIRAGRVSLDLEPVLLRGIINRAVDRFRAEGLGARFEIRVDPDAIALADADRVDEMLTNVLQNAIKYAPGATPIEISARVRESVVELAVRDHGPGVPDHEMPLLFERFERGSQAGSQTPGMGLGLYIVRMLVESQGGSVRLESPPDGGTEVIMTLPAADDGVE